MEHSEVLGLPAAGLSDADVIGRHGLAFRAYCKFGVTS